jgi:hypothetical protein
VAACGEKLSGESFRYRAKSSDAHLRDRHKT